MANRLITVTIDSIDLLYMLMDRLSELTNDDDIYQLYMLYYEELINNSCFDDIQLDIKAIVDNDYYNYLRVVDDEELNNEYPNNIPLQVTTDLNGKKWYLIEA